MSSVLYPNQAVAGGRITDAVASAAICGFPFSPGLHSVVRASWREAGGCQTQPQYDIGVGVPPKLADRLLTRVCKEEVRTQALTYI